MNEGKIIQIIPNTRNLYACFEDEESSFSNPIVCFALVEYSDEYNDTHFRCVEPMSISVDGFVEPFMDERNFQYIFEGNGLGGTFKNEDTK